MRLFEFLTERITAGEDINGIIVRINTHAIDRAHERIVSPGAVEAMLRKLNFIKSKIENLESHDEFWVYSDSFSTGLGFRKYDDRDGKMCIVLNTVISDVPHREGRVAVFYIP